MTGGFSYHYFFLDIEQYDEVLLIQYDVVEQIVYHTVPLSKVWNLHPASALWCIGGSLTNS